MVFTVQVLIARETFNYVVKRELVDSCTERFTLQRGEEKYIVTSNRPLLRSNPLLKKQAPVYTLQESPGEFLISTWQKIQDGLRRHIAVMELSGAL